MGTVPQLLQTFFLGFQISDKAAKAIVTCPRVHAEYAVLRRPGPEGYVYWIAARKSIRDAESVDASIAACEGNVGLLWESMYSGYFLATGLMVLKGPVQFLYASAGSYTAVERKRDVI